MTLPGFSWNYAGLMIRAMVNFDRNAAVEAYAAGFRCLAPWVGNDAYAAQNLAQLDSRRSELEGVGYLCGGIWNGLGGDPVVDAANINVLLTAHHLHFLILDIESAYVWPDGQWAAFPALLTEIRKRNPVGSFPFAVTSYGYPVDSMIWTQCHPLGFRYLPQWYSGSYQRDGHFSPQWCMDYLRSGAAAKDPNIGSGVLPEDVRAVVESSGTEGANLGAELADVAQAKPPLGLWLFPGEAPGPDDLTRIAAAKNVLFRVP